MSAVPLPVIDVSKLPETVFGVRNITGWATIAFIVIEGTTLAIALVAYFYVRRNFAGWPPPPTGYPDLLAPTINTMVLLLTIAPMALADRGARALDLRRVRIGLGVAVALSVLAVILRGFEFAALNTRWDSHAYGSVVWVLVGLHSTLLIVDLLETAAIWALTFSKRMQRKHFTDVEDAAFYQYFLSLSWLPIYVVVFWGPRVF